MLSQRCRHSPLVKDTLVILTEKKINEFSRLTIINLEHSSECRVIMLQNLLQQTVHRQANIHVIESIYNIQIFKKFYASLQRLSYWILWPLVVLLPDNTSYTLLCNINQIQDSEKGDMQSWLMLTASQTLKIVSFIYSQST